MENYELPPGWAMAHLKDLVSSTGIFSDGDWVESKDQDPNGSVRLVQLADIGEMTFLDKSRRYMAESTSLKMGCTFLRKGDLLISRLGDPLGKTCVYPAKEERAVTAVDVCILRPDHDGVEPKLFGFFLNGGSLRRAVDQQASGTTRKRITGTKLKDLPVPVPPTNEQRRIVEKIEMLFARLEKGEEALRDVQKLLTRYRQSVLKAAVTGQLTADWRAENAHRLEPGQDLLARILQNRRETWDGRGKYKEPVAPDTSDLPELPEGWVWATLDQLTRIVTKGSSPNWQGFEYVLDGVLFIRSQNVGWGDLRLEDRAFLPEGFNHKETKSIIRNGDLLLNIVGASIGRAAVATDELDGANCNQAVAVIRLVDRSMSPFVLRYLLSPAAQSRIHSEKVDVARANYSLEQIRMLSVPIPPMEEWEEIARQVDYAESQILTLQDWCQTELARSAALRQSILKDAFAGRLVPQDPADEPAAALLARIKETRAATPKKKNSSARS